MYIIHTQHLKIYSLQTKFQTVIQTQKELIVEGQLQFQQESREICNLWLYLLTKRDKANSYYSQVWILIGLHAAWNIYTEWLAKIATVCICEQ